MTESTSPPVGTGRVNPGALPVRRRNLLYGAVAGTAALAGLGLSWWRNRSGASTPLDTSALWNRSFDTLGPAPLAMRSLAGRPLLINFWATWCPPCVEELPLLNRFYEEHRRNGWQVLGLAVDQKAAVEAFLRRAPVGFMVAMAGMPGIELSKTLGNIGGGLPFTAIFGSDGQVLHRKMGRVTALDLQQWSQLK